MKNEIPSIVLSFTAGFALGALFFYGLWLTVRKAVRLQRPSLWFLASFLIRTGITLTGFYYVAHGDWQRAMICLAGFIVARYAVKYFIQFKQEKKKEHKKEVSHET